LRPTVVSKGVRTVILPEQPFQVLRLLIEREGELATREEIRKNLWPNDTAVDFNHSINVAIGTLRRALRDSAETPQYIETLARRGYRLITPTEWVRAVEEPSAGGPGPEDEEESQGIEAAGLIGKKVLHYRVLEVIGGGGMGMVYKAEDLKLGRRVALKFLPEELAGDAMSLCRFEREAQTASSLNHANICTIHAIEEHEGQPFIAMELLEGETLRDLLAASEGNPLPLSKLLEIAGQICHGLEAAHGKGIIHRDIKPANIFLTRQGRVKILDFGLAKLAATEDREEGHTRPGANLRESSIQKGSATMEQVDVSLTRTGIAVGTAGYMSPEQIRKERLDARTDLFSFGLILYEMSTGRRAFTGDTAEVLHDAILHQTPPAACDLNPAVPAWLEAVLARAIEKDRRQRYQSAADMCADLEAFQGEKRRRLRHLWKPAAGFFLVLAASGGIYWHARNTIALSANDTVVLADTSNQTSEPVFDDALNTALRVEFEQTPFLHLLSPDKVRGALKSLAREDAKLTPERARDVCLRTHSRAVIAASISDAGNHFKLELDGIECTTGHTFARVKRDVAGREEIVHALGTLGVQLRSKLGEPRSSVVKFSKPLDEAASSSLDALQLLTQGYRHSIARDEVAVSDYQRAIEFDPNFALAYVALGSRYSNVEQMTLASAAETKAYELRDRLTGPARFLIETLYYEIATGQLEEAYPVHLQWAQTFPSDVRGHINLSSCLMMLGREEQATGESREAVRLLPSMATYSNLIRAALLANLPNEAKTAFNEAEARGIDDPSFHSLRHLVAFMQQDDSAMREQLDWAMDRREIAEPVFYGEAGRQAYHGNFRTATQWLERATDASGRANSVAAITADQVDFALQEAEAGKIKNAQQLTAGLISGAQAHDTRIELALLFARSGNIEQARQLSTALSKESPLDTLLQNYSLPAIRAAIQLQQNDAAGAIESLRPAVKYDLASPTTFNSLYPAYLRGLAYLRMNNGRQAAAEFQKLIDHPGTVGRFVTGSLVRLQLGRAQAMAGDQAAARKSYQEFLLLWQDADPDIPIYTQAKVEYARLN
jgi:eukaryotic-like serine/threonine-protein kinase